ncbi:unnamed protein product [Mytilus coruscus]|uniref:Uncharacterized protein n=1 Tax=Mytilus coruscus TaxID=42192 RepID=A0A6J8ERY0_MYTCO|nr:unnamed protein product [Mytilus coruscus]
MLTKFDTLTGAVMEMENSLKKQGKTFENYFEKSGDSLNNTMTNLTQLQQPFPFLQEINDIQINIEAARQRDLIKDMWKKSLNERKIAYYNALRCDKNAEIYIKWQTMENPILPEKFLIREIKGEHCEETEIRGPLALQRLATEVSLLQTRKHRFEENFLSIDATVLAEISEKCKGNIEAKLHEMWTQDTKREEEKSKAETSRTFR